MDESLRRIIDTLAAKKGVAPVELSPPLQEAIDTDALVHLLESESVSVCFKYDEYVVTINGTGDLTVTSRVE
jgi:hypothetical protein